MMWKKGDTKDILLYVSTYKGMSRTDKYQETIIWLIDSWGRGKEELGSDCQLGKWSLFGVESDVELGNGDGCTVLWIY